MVTTVAEVRVVPPLSVAVTVDRSCVESSSPKVEGLALSVMPVGASSSSVMVVVTLLDVPRMRVGPPPPDGPDGDGERLACRSSMSSSVVWTVKVCDPVAVCVKVSVPDLAV